MNDLLLHRGPDNEGFLLKDIISLGHRRLSIIDLSENGIQPMSNEFNNIFLVCNGEIYNYKELTEHLIIKGHKFKSKSDSEVLLHLYEEYDENLLNKVNGMFSFAIWDEKNKKLIAAVDRFGKKPLYYSVNDKRLVFSSELKSLLLIPWINKNIDYNAVDRYFNFRYVPAPRTIFSDVKKLEQSNMMIWKDGEVSIKRYWKPQKLNLIEYNDYEIDNLYKLLTDAITVRLNSDVPLGIYLSGGIDSSTIAGIMNNLIKKNKVSYTVSFENEYNENEKAANIAKYLDFEFNSIEILNDDFDNISKLVYHLDEPYGDMIVLPSYNLSRKAKEQLTVVLTGDGADEIFSGYFHQKIMLKWKKYEYLLKMPLFSEIFSNITKRIPLSFLNSHFDYPDKLGNREKLKISQVAENSKRFGTFYESFTSCFTPQDKALLYTEDLKKRITHISLSDEIENQILNYKNEGFTFLSQLSLLDLKYWIPFIVLYRLDKLNMANSVETRSPYLDYRLVEMALNLEDSGKLNKNSNKQILRAINKKLFPDRLYEKGKQAFYMPFLAKYSVKFYEWCNQMLNKDKMVSEGLYNWKYIEELFIDSKNGSMLASRQLVALSMFEQWKKVFLVN